MTFDEFVALASSDARWRGVTKLPWGDAAFSERMLREHLSQLHDGASRRTDLIERHVGWIHDVVLERQPRRILDLGCGPGLYTQRLAALGHECTGIDISPASIAHAQAQVSESAHTPLYTLGDVTTSDFAGPFDLVMMIHGEFNTFPRDVAAALLWRIARALAPGGRLLLEVHPIAAVEAMGRRPRSWSAAQRGLFRDAPHVRMDESRWHANEAQAVSLNWIIDGQTVERYGTVTEAYTDHEYQQLLADAGFSDRVGFPGLAGDTTNTNYAVWVAAV